MRGEASRRLRIEGRVQGVGYRAWCVGQARGLNLRGWVRNRADGTVEVFVQGDTADVEALIARCRKGPVFAKVTDVIVSDAVTDGPCEAADQPASGGFVKYPTL
jgi:acylphosphatase